MSRQLQKLRKDKSPLAEDVRILEIDQDVDRYAAIAAFTTSEGGKELRKALRSDIASAINNIIAAYRLADAQKILGYAATIDARVSLLLALGNAQTNREDAEKMLDELTS